jgi:glycosyltransferase involved in cell wall biosynthesis
MKISTVIITRNEQHHIARCVDSVQGVAEEVLVVDSGSDDQTKEIAASLGARVLERPWTGYSDQKNFAAEQASHDWILSLDADERLSDPLRLELIRLKQSGSAVDAYAFPRKAYYLGRWINHSGWYPDPKIRLYRRDQGSWAGAFVHESIVVKGAVVQCKGDLLHFTCDSIEEHLERLHRYTSLAAEELWQGGKTAGQSRLVLSPLIAFIKSYFVKYGFLDGPQGLMIAGFAAYYNFLKYAKLWEKQRAARVHKS